MNVFIFFVGLCCLVSTGYAQATNPFAIDFPEKSDLTHEDYKEIQKQLRAIDIDQTLMDLYDSNLDPFDAFKQRCSKGISQILIDPERGLFPAHELKKIGSGGDRCIVSCCPYNGIYNNLIESIPDALEANGFNGYFLYRMGGFPNPTGTEIKYAGVPYSFKIFMMLEAQKLGFNDVLWIDSSMLPIRDPTPLFSAINESGTFISYCYFPDTPRIFPKTRALLHELTGVDVAYARHICTQVFGLKMDIDKTREFINSYYKFVEMGTPFLSCFPEEFVFTSLFEQSPQDWPSTAFIFHVLKYPETSDSSDIETAKNNGCYFYLRPH